MSFLKTGDSFESKVSCRDSQACCAEDFECSPSTRILWVDAKVETTTGIF